jgi:hypothetical protein
MAEKRVIELEIQDNSKSLKAQYKEAVQELQKVSAQYGETSEQAIKAAKAAAELKDQIGFSKDLVDSFNPDAKFNALSKSVGGVLDGFQAVEGAMGLVGVESEALQETMLRVQSAMALSQGIQGLMEAKDSFKQLGAVAMNALKGIKGALAATGIGLFLVALGTVVAYWDDIKEAVSGVSDEQEQLNEKTEANLKISEEKVSALDKQDNILKLQGKTEKEILQYKINELDIAIKIAQVNLENQKATKTAQVEAAKRNRDILLGIISFLNKPLVNLLETIDKIVEWATGDKSNLAKALKAQELELANLIFDPDGVSKEGDAAIKAAEDKLIELKNQQAGYQIAIKEINKQGSNDVKENKKAELDALIELEIRKEHTDKQRLEKLLADRLKLEKLKGNQLLLAEQDNAEKVRQAIEEDNKEVINLETKKLDTLQVLRDTKLEGLKGSLNAEVEAEKQAAEHKQAVLEAQAVRAQKLEENSQSFKVKSVQQGLEIISSLTELFGKKSEKAARKAFQINKAANIATAIISTYQSATAAYASQFTPVPDPTSPVRGGIAAGMAIAAGLVNVAKIASQKFEGGGSSGGGGGAPAGGGGGGMVTPNFNVIGSSGVNQLAQIQQQPTRAYVVSGDVANGLSLERNRLQNATL